MRIICPHCGTSMNGTEQFIGRKARCASCRQVFTIARPEKAGIPLADEPRKQTAGKSAKTDSSSPVGPRLPEGFPTPYYARPGWKGKYDSAKFAYRPSGKCSPVTFACMACFSGVGIFLGSLFVSGVFNLMGWSFLVVDLFLVAIGFGLGAGCGSLIGRGCRNRWLGALTALCGVVLAWILLDWLAPADPNAKITISYKAVAGTEVEVGLWRHMELIFLALAGAGGLWASVGTSPDCEKCGKSYQRFRLFEGEKVPPETVLSLLLQNRVPTEVDVKHAPPPAVNKVHYADQIVVDHQFCPICRQGVLSAKCKFGDSETVFYSELWTADEVEAGRRG
ncbi:MAG TPA: hypothetical protein PK082_09850 [Phycisphaerae bacterium]|nr:hypothetical protein [Phycisphaerae bacterium]